jgi:DNA-binding NtrC family response regulator
VADLLIVDDDRNVCTVLQGLLEEAGHTVRTARDVDSATTLLGECDPAVVITDLKMPGKSGLDLLSWMRQNRPAVPVLMITAHGDIETAVKAMKSGAHDFITKPFDEDELMHSLSKALSESVRNRELLPSFFEPGEEPTAEMISVSPVMQEIFQSVRKIAPTDSTVLITGETGVGKELIVRSLHAESARRDRPLIKVNCAAIPDALIESEMFGYEKGAFSGAVTSKPGRFELADRGTLFLDEIGELPLHLQAKLLTVLQDRTFERVGGVRTIHVDVRIITATNRDLNKAVAAGTFRSDLFYRLNVVPISVPPLRERKADIMPLARHFMKKNAKKHAKPVDDIAADLASAFMAYPWPGNIRELENAVESMVVVSDQAVIGLEDAPKEIRCFAGFGASVFRETMDTIAGDSEKRLIVEALEKTKHNRTKAAELLGISRRTLQYKIKKHSL